VGKLSHEPHRLLARQLRKLGLTSDAPPDAAQWRQLLEVLASSYHEADRGRYTLERSLTISSEEMQQLYRQLQQSSEARLRAITDAIPDLLFLLDEDGRYLGIHAASSSGKLYRAADELAGRTIHEVLPTAFAQRLGRVIDEALAGKSMQVLEYELDVPDGRCEFEARVVPTGFREQGKRTLVVLTRDITERKHAEAQARLVSKVIEAATEAVVILAADRRVLSVNPAFESMFGKSADAVVGTRFPLCQDASNPLFMEQVWSAIEETGNWQGEIKGQRGGGETFPLWLTLDAVALDSPAVTHYVALLTDVTEIKHSRQELEHIATHDTLTGLPNRVLFQDRLGQAVSRALRSKVSGALLFLDLDRFKNINDSLGHQIGDELLRQVARRLAELLRQQDTLARLGGDEFTVIIEQISGRAQATRVAEKILSAFARPFQLLDYEIEITTSIGISLFPLDGTEFDQLTKHADTAMYSAKEAGRNQYRFFTQDLTSTTYEFFSLEQGLRRALTLDEFELHYQPQFDLRTDGLIGFEALLRWNSPKRGLVGPAEFIPVAEVTGLIEQVGRWVLDAVCRQINDWLRAGREFGRVAINLSRRQLANSALVKTVDEVLKRHGLAGHYLEFELTESAIIEHDDIAYRNLVALFDLGALLSIDDFGTGHSSLINLKRFPLSRLKIDRTFVRDVIEDPNDEAIIRATIALGQSLGLRIVAEGIENTAQLELLRHAGCDEGQGYLLGRPMTVTQVEQFLAGRTVA